MVELNRSILLVAKVAIFIKSDDTLWGMGKNSYGELGDGTTTQRNTPVQIWNSPVLKASGSYHSIFLELNGSLHGMGLNANGQLGDVSVQQ